MVCVCAGRAAGRAAGRCFVCRYGRYNPADGSTTEVHAVYEPPQSVDEFGAIEVHPEDADAQARVDAVADGLHLTKVGVMFCHPYRATKSAMSSMEVLFAAEQQLQSCDGDIDAAPNRFVTVVVRQTEDGMADFQACVRACVRACAPGGGGRGGGVGGVHFAPLSLRLFKRVVSTALLHAAADQHTAARHVSLFFCAIVGVGGTSPLPAGAHLKRTPTRSHALAHTHPRAPTHPYTYTPFLFRGGGCAGGWCWRWRLRWATTNTTTIAATATTHRYQVTRQCMEMVAKGMLLWGMDDPYQCDIHEMFTAITVKHNKEKTRVMKNEDKSVAVEFLVQNVAMKSHRCPFLDPLNFPIANRCVALLRWCDRSMIVSLCGLRRRVFCIVAAAAFERTRLWTTVM